VVSAAGELVRGSGVSSARLLPSSTGAYQVTFRGDVSRCAYIATGADGPLLASVASRAGNEHAVYVETRDLATGALSNRPFQLAAHCRGKGFFAVVGADGDLERGGKVRSSTRVADGSYVVMFAKPVAGCAVEATVGTVDIGVVADPGLVSVAPLASDPRAVEVRVVTRSGLAVDQPFHVSATCHP
jgi:hypothetical protein